MKKFAAIIAGCLVSLAGCWIAVDPAPATTVYVEVGGGDCFPGEDVYVYPDGSELCCDPTVSCCPDSSACCDSPCY